MKRYGRAAAAGFAFVVLGSVSCMPTQGGEDSLYRAEIKSWREEREARLTADDGWLTVAGLFWLREGESRFGTDPLNDFVLPEGSAPARAGTFQFENGRTTVRIEPGVTATLQGEPVTEAELEPGEKNAIEIGSLRLWVHKSGERHAIRLRDQNSPLRRDFTGLRWFPVDEGYRVEARFVPYEEPRPVEMLNILGDIEKYTSPGYLEFSLQGEDLTLVPVNLSDGRLFIVFRDLTSGKESYPAARFLTTEGPENGVVVLDFNKAYNPPCTFNPYTTCPLPIEENRLSLRIAAGEMNYHHSETD